MAMQKTSNLVDDTKEIIVKDLNAWYVKYDDTINLTQCNGDRIIELLTIKFIDYVNLSIYNLFPFIYIKNHNLISEYVDWHESFNFMPRFEFADNDNAYIKCINDEFIDVVVNISSIITNISESNSVSLLTPLSKTYLMIDGNGYYKIGKSFNPEARERTLQSENPTINLVAICDDDIEKLLHAKYKKYNVRGEWFKLDVEQVNLIIKEFSFIKFQ